MNRRAFLGRSSLLVMGAATLPSLGASGAPTPAHAQAKKRGGVARVAISDGSPKDVLDPLVQNNFFMPIAFGAIYESLVDLSNGFQPQPKLAERWEVSSDYKSWTFHLRKGVQFHDGTRLTAKDVAYSIRRNLDPKSGSPLVSTLGTVVKPDNVRALDDHTVRLTLDAPYVFVANTLGVRYARILKDGTTDFTKPVGTGPFVFREFTPGQSFAATRNPNYWQSGKPHLDGIKMTNVPEQASKVQALLAGQYDLIDNIEYSLGKTIEASAGYGVLELKDARWVPLILDLRVKPFDDPRIVKAFKLAVDRPQLLDTIYAGYGSTGYDTPIPSSDPFFNADLPKPKRDIQAAKDLLRHAGYPNGLDVPAELIVAPLVGSMVNLAVGLKEQLADAGIRVKVRQWPAATFWDDAWLKKPMYIPEWNRRHPGEILPICFSSKGVWNQTGIANPELDKALQEAAQTTDFGRQKELYGLAQKIIAETDGTVMPVYASRVWGRSRKLHDVHLNFVTFSDYTDAAFA